MNANRWLYILCFLYPFPHKPLDVTITPRYINYGLIIKIKMIELRLHLYLSIIADPIIEWLHIILPCCLLNKLTIMNVCHISIANSEDFIWNCNILKCILNKNNIYEWSPFHYIILLNYFRYISVTKNVYVNNNIHTL